MPNICENEVSIYSADANQIRSFMKFVKSKDCYFDFNKIVPSPNWNKTPDENGELPTKVKRIRNSEGKLVMTIRSFPTSGKTDDRWYDWNIKNWGTKWGSFNGSMEFDKKYGDEVSYKFDTAWSPPAPILKALQDKFPDISIGWLYGIETWESCGFLHQEV